MFGVGCRDSAVTRPAVVVGESAVTTGASIAVSGGADQIVEPGKAL